MVCEIPENGGLKTLILGTILKAPSGTFEHAGVKTNVVIFTKDGPTQNIHFLETTKECNIVKDMFTISAKELTITNYSLDVGEYLVDTSEIYDVPMVTLGDVCQFRSGKFNSKDMDNKGDVPFYTSSAKNPVGKHSRYSFDHNEYILITTAGGSQTNLDGNHGMGKVYLVNGKTACRSTVNAITIKIENMSYKYLYMILKFNRLNINKLANFTTNLGVISKVKLLKFKIPLPSLEIQQQIVNELSHIEKNIETINLRIKQLTYEKGQYKKYGRKAEIRGLLKDSKEKMLSDICEIKEKGNVNTKSITNSGEYPFYAASAKILREHIIHIVLIIPVTTYYLLNLVVMVKNPISYSHGIGMVYYMTEKAAANTEVVKITVKDHSISLKYIFQYLKNKQLDIQKLAKYSANGNLGHIKMLKFKSLHIPVPSQEIQQQCISIFEEKEKFIQSIDQMIQQEKEHIENLKQLAKDIISSYC